MYDTADCNCHVAWFGTVIVFHESRSTAEIKICADGDSTRNPYLPDGYVQVFNAPVQPNPIVIALLPFLLQFRLCGRLLCVLVRACSGFAGELGIDMTSS